MLKAGEEHEFWNEAEYREHLMTNKNIKVVLVPSSTSNMNLLGFSWQLSSL